MSFVNILKSITVVIIGGLSGYNLIKFTLQTNEHNRSLASVAISKLATEQVAASLFEAELDLKKIANTESDTSEISVTITALKSITSGLNYNWVLPNDVHVVEGNTQDQLGSFAIGESKVIVIKVNGFSKELKKYLSFQIEGNANLLPIKREILVSSRIEDSLEYLIQQGEKAKQKNSFNKLNSNKPKTKFSIENVVK